MNANDIAAMLMPLVLAGGAAVVRAACRTWLTPQRLAHVTDIASMAVEAAEKLGADLAPVLAEAGTNKSTAKLNYAAGVVAVGAKRLGVKLTSDEVLAFVHAALADMERAKADEHAAA